MAKIPIARKIASNSIFVIIAIGKVQVITQLLYKIFIILCQIL